MHGGDHRSIHRALEQVAHEIAPGPVAMDDVDLLPGYQLFQLPQPTDGVPGLDYVDGHAHLGRVVGELPLAEAHQLGVDEIVQLPQQVEHMGFRAAGVAAADQVNYAHTVHSFVFISSIFKPALISFFMWMWGQCSSRYSSPSWA